MIRIQLSALERNIGDISKTKYYYLYKCNYLYCTTELMFRIFDFQLMMNFEWKQPSEKEKVQSTKLCKLA